jgi:hypothetical protein
MPAATLTTYTCRKCRTTLRQRLPLPDGLCVRCWRQSHANDVGRPPSKPASQPSESLPGTRERVLEYEQRAEQGEELYHGADARNDSDETSLASALARLPYAQVLRGLTCPLRTT